mgnify:CR=1 FL=1
MRVICVFLNQARDPGSDEETDPGQSGSIIRARLKLLLTAEKPSRFRVAVCSLDALDRPIRYTKRSNSTGSLVLIEDVDKLIDRDFWIVAMQHVQVDVICLEALEAF